MRKKIALFGLLASVTFAASAQERPLDLELHNQWLDRDRTTAEKALTATPDSDAHDEVAPWPSADLWECEKEAVSGNIWLVSRHKGKDRKKKLQENNTGVGIVYSCDAWSVSLDKMINSNNGKAIVASVLWSTPDAELGPALVRGTAGYSWLSYGVPKYHATLYAKTAVAYASVRLKGYERFSVNIAKVPKTAGNAYIIWITYELIRFGK